MRRIFSVTFWTFFAVSSVFFYLGAVIIWLATFFFDPQRRTNHLWSCLWASTYAWVYPGWNIRVTGRHHIDPKGTYVIVANHTSIADIVLCFTLFRQFKWVSKKAVFRYPLLGWNMALCRYIPLVRGDKTSIERMLETCRVWLTEGMSILLFPEGTRSETGELRPFKHGAFTLALQTGKSVLPVVIHGGYQLIPKHGATFAARADVWVEICPEIPAQTGETVESYADRVRDFFSAELAKKTA